MALLCGSRLLSMMFNRQKEELLHPIKFQEALRMVTLSMCLPKFWLDVVMFNHISSSQPSSAFIWISATIFVRTFFNSIGYYLR